MQTAKEKIFQTGAVEYPSYGTEQKVKTEFSVSNQHAGVVVRALTKNLYKRPAYGVFRELVSNAVDGVRKSGTNKIFINLPRNVTYGNDGDYVNPKDVLFGILNKFENTDITPEEYALAYPFNKNTDFVIRDFGTGIEPELFTNLYTTLFSSSKRDDPDSLGYFGLGSKSPFALSDVFIVYNFWEGKKYHYIAELLEAEAKLTMISCKDTNEPNGLCVIIPNVEGRVVTNVNQLLFFDDIDFLGNIDTTYHKKLWENNWFQGEYFRMGNIETNQTLIGSLGGVFYECQDISFTYQAETRDVDSFIGSFGFSYEVIVDKIYSGISLDKVRKAAAVEFVKRSLQRCTINIEKFTLHENCIGVTLPPSRDTINIELNVDINEFFMGIVVEEFKDYVIEFMEAFTDHWFNVDQSSIMELLNKYSPEHEVSERQIVETLFSSFSEHQYRDKTFSGYDGIVIRVLNRVSANNAYDESLLYLHTHHNYSYDELGNAINRWNDSKIYFKKIQHHLPLDLLVAKGIDLLSQQSIAFWTNDDGVILHSSLNSCDKPIVQYVTGTPAVVKNVINTGTSRLSESFIERIKEAKGNAIALVLPMNDPYFKGIHEDVDIYDEIDVFYRGIVDKFGKWKKDTLVNKDYLAAPDLNKRNMISFEAFLKTTPNGLREFERFGKLKFLVDRLAQASRNVMTSFNIYSGLFYSSHSAIAVVNEVLKAVTNLEMVKTKDLRKPLQKDPTSRRPVSPIRVRQFIIEDDLYYKQKETYELEFSGKQKIDIEDLEEIAEDALVQTSMYGGGYSHLFQYMSKTSDLPNKFIGKRVITLDADQQQRFSSNYVGITGKTIYQYFTELEQQQTNELYIEFIDEMLERSTDLENIFKSIIVRDTALAVMSRITDIVDDGKKIRTAIYDELSRKHRTNNFRKPPTYKVEDTKSIRNYVGKHINRTEVSMYSLLSINSRNKKPNNYNAIQVFRDFYQFKKDGGPMFEIIAELVEVQRKITERVLIEQRLYKLEDLVQYIQCVLEYARSILPKDTYLLGEQYQQDVIMYAASKYSEFFGPVVVSRNNQFLLNHLSNRLNKLKEEINE